MKLKLSYATALLLVALDLLYLEPRSVINLFYLKPHYTRTRLTDSLSHIFDCMKWHKNEI